MPASKKKKTEQHAPYPTARQTEACHQAPGEDPEVNHMNYIYCLFMFGNWLNIYKSFLASMVPLEWILYLRYCQILKNDLCGNGLPF